MARSRAYQADTLRSVEASNITASYANLGSALTKNWKIFTIKNATNRTIFISENGTDDHYELPPFSTDTYDLQSNTVDKAMGEKVIGTQFSVKGVSGSMPTLGKVIIQGQYL